MTDGILDSRRMALEEAFFARHNEALRQGLIAADAAQARHAALAAASGITDPAALSRFEQLGLASDTLLALTMAPLVLMAWVDGAVAPEEARAVRDSAAANGLRPESPAMGLLTGWLSTPPPAALEAAWRDYAQGLAQRMAPEARATLAAQVLAQARAVAEAEGGFLGLTGRVSGRERELLARLETAFHM